MEINIPPRWGFWSFGVGGYNVVAAPELKNGSSPAAPIAPQQWDWGEGERNRFSATATVMVVIHWKQRRTHSHFPAGAAANRVRA
jgi:hypothetical protein